MNFFTWLGKGFLVVVYEGNILSIATASNENSIKASWLIILGYLKVGIGVPFSNGYIWNMGSSTMGIPFGVLTVVLPASSFSCNVFARSLFACLVSLALSCCATLSSGESMRCLIFRLSFDLLGLEFLFLTLFWPPSEFGIVGETFCHLPYLPLVWVDCLV